MRHVAFLRNLNQGQRNNPTSQQLVAAFERAGASGMSLVRGNGTVVFDAAEPRACAEDAAALLRGTGWRDLVFVRSVAAIVDILSLPAVAEDAARLELGLFDESLAPPATLVGRRCAVVESGAGFAVVLNELDRESNGTPTLERALGVKVTSRGLATVQLVAQRG